MHLFAYGTLMDEEIMTAVCGHRFAAKPATLLNYRRHSIKGKIYPAIIGKQGAKTDGICYLDLPQVVWQSLDLFEDDMYERTTVTVITGDGVLLDAEAYVCKLEFKNELEDEDWDFDEFLKKTKKIFKQEYEGFSDPSRSSKKKPKKSLACEHAG